MQVKDVMQSPVMTIAAEATLDQALAIMDRYDISHLPVLQNQVLGGVLTRPGLWAALHTPKSTGSSPEQLRCLHSLRVLEMMRHDVQTLSQEAPTHEAARLVWEEGAPCIAVVRDRKPVGIVGLTELLDVFMAAIDQQQQRKYKRLLVPTHFSPSAHHAVRKGLELMHQHEASLVLLHVRKRLSAKFQRTSIAHQPSW